MAIRCRLLDRLTRRLGSEAGFAVPTVMLMTVAALGMAGVAVMTSIEGQGGIVRDESTKTALGVAESGVDQALLHFNRHGLVSEANLCEPVSVTGPDAYGWCGPFEGLAVNSGSVTYYVRPTAEGELEIVSVGAFGQATRRVDVSASSASGRDIFLKATVQSKDGITLDSNAEIHAGSATNGDITLSSNSRQCGVASVGIGKKLKGNGYYADLDCGTPGGSPIEDEIDLPPVNQGSAATVNDNGRFFAEDLISGNKADACWSGLKGDGKAGSCGTRELVIENNSSVTLGGAVYSFCKLIMKSNSSLYVASSKVEIFFDSPEACGYESGVMQMELLSNSRITAASGVSADVALLFVGSEDLATGINLNSNTSVDGPCEQNFVIYAPYTDIDLDSNTKFCGGLAGKTVHMDSNAQVWTSSGIENFVLPNTAPHYVVNRFVDCTATPVAGLPNEGC